MEGHVFLTHFLTRIAQRGVQVLELVQLLHRIAKRRDEQDAILGFRGRLGRLRTLVREGPRAPFLARAQSAIPQIDERRKTALQGGKAEPIAEILDVGSVQPLDELFHARTCFKWRARKAAREIHVVFPFQLPQLHLKNLQLALEVRDFRHFFSWR